MKTTIRNRAAALGVAAVAGIAGVGLVSGPALAAPAPAAATSADAESQSAHYPTDAAEYADAFVKAWGAGDMIRVDALLSADAADDMYGHTNESATDWVRTGSDSAMGGKVGFHYKNSVTGEKMNVVVPWEKIENNGGESGIAHGILRVQFDY